MRGQKNLILIIAEYISSDYLIRQKKCLTILAFASVDTQIHRKFH